MAAGPLTAPRAPALLLLYHGLGPARGAAARFALPVARFQEHLAVIQQALRAGALASASLEAWWSGAAAPSVPTLLLCFDDGLVSDHRVALPLLLAHGLQATFFVNTAQIGLPGYLAWPQIRELRQAGMDIQSHGHEHTVLARLASPALEAALRTSRHILQDRVGTPVHFLAAPYGLWNRRVREVALSCGFRALCVSRPGLAAAGRTVLPRNGVGAATSAPQLQDWLRCRHLDFLWRQGRNCLLWPPKQMLWRCRPDWPAPAPPLDWASMS